MITRRSFLRGLLAAPIVVRSGLVMPVKPLAHLEGEMLTIASTPMSSLGGRHDASNP